MLDPKAFAINFVIVASVMQVSLSDLPFLYFSPRIWCDRLYVVKKQRRERISSVLFVWFTSNGGRCESWLGKWGHETRSPFPMLLLCTRTVYILVHTDLRQLILLVHYKIIKMQKGYVYMSNPVA